MKRETTKREPTVLACPECGEPSFSWIVEQVQFGTVSQYDDGSMIEEGMKMGEIVDDDVEENGVFCTTCDEFRERDELVPHEEGK